MRGQINFPHHSHVPENVIYVCIGVVIVLVFWGAVYWSFAK
jgi:hypothetical protein